MGKTFFAWVFLAFFLLLVTLPFYATMAETSCVRKTEVGWPPSPVSKIQPCGDVSFTFAKLVKYLYEWSIVLGFIALFIVLVYAGFQYLTSAGDPRKMQKAIGQIGSSLAGLGLLLGSYLILNIINPQLTALRMPPLKWDQGGIDISSLEELEKDKYRECEKVLAFNVQGSSVKVTPNDKCSSPTDLAFESLEVYGSCKVNLYSKVDCNNRDLIQSLTYLMLKEANQPTRVPSLREQIQYEEEARISVNSIKVEEFKF